MSRIINGQEYTNPLEDDQFMAKLVGLEETFYRGRVSPDVIGELCLLYADLVQYYDFKKDVIANYFLERIHIVSCAQLYTRGPLLGKPNEGLPAKVPSPQQGKSQMPLEELIATEQKFLKHLIDIRPSIKQLSFDERKVQRQRTAILRNKLEEENQRICDNIPLKLVEMEGQMKVIDAFVVSNLQNQEDRIREKLEERKRNSFARSTTLNSSSSIIGGTDSKENSFVYGQTVIGGKADKTRSILGTRHREGQDLGILAQMDNILDGLNNPPALKDRVLNR